MKIEDKIKYYNDEDEINFEVFLNQLGYPFWDETDNPAYKLFLG